MHHIYNDHVSHDMQLNKFKDIFLKAWKIDKFGSLVIDKDREINNGRYRIGFDCIYKFNGTAEKTSITNQDVTIRDLKREKNLIN